MSGAATGAMNSEKTKANQTIAPATSNESCAKNGNKSPSPMTKIFTNASSFIVGTEQPAQTYAANEDDLISICENIERIAIESALDQTNPTTTTTTKTTHNNQNHNNFNRIVDETTNSSNSNWLINSADDKTEHSTNDPSARQLFLNLDDSNALTMKNKLRHIDSGELPWWMTADEPSADDTAINPVESETRAPESNIGNGNGVASWMFPSEDQNRGDEAPKPMYRFTKIRSGERAWWMDSDEKGENAQNGTGTANHYNNNNVHEDSVEPESTTTLTFKIKRIESGEKAWWMTNDGPDTENADNIDFWSEINEKNEAERKCHVRQHQEHERNFYSGGVTDTTEGPLGQRASPEGLEDMTSQRREFSPYACTGDPARDTFGKNSASKLFISRHQNIDDLLGGTSHTMNLMLMDRNDFNAPYEEILPAQVRIHDGSAHTSYVQHIGDER